MGELFLLVKRMKARAGILATFLSFRKITRPVTRIQLSRDPHDRCQPLPRRSAGRRHRGRDEVRRLPHRRHGIPLGDLHSQRRGLHDRLLSDVQVWFRHGGYDQDVPFRWDIRGFHHYVDLLHRHHQPHGGPAVAAGRRQHRPELGGLRRRGGPRKAAGTIGPTWACGYPRRRIPSSSAGPRP